MSESGLMQSLIGQTIDKINGLEVGSDRATFYIGNREFQMLHYQDCCENVRIEDIEGDVDDLIGSPITQFEEVSNEPEPDGYEYDESHTWTFYKIATIKGYLTIRWLGESNGWYSESVYFVEISCEA